MEKVLSLVILIVTLIGMIFEEEIGVKLCITGCVGAILLILTGVISEKDALKSIDLKTISCSEVPYLWQRHWKLPVQEK